MEQMGASSSKEVQKRMLQIEILREISRLSVAVAEEFKGTFPDDILQAFTLVGKYLTIAGLDKTARKEIGMVTGPSHCPLCTLYKDKECKGCILKDQDEAICGQQYNSIRHAITEGTYTDVAFNISRMIRSILKRLERENGLDRNNKHVNNNSGMDISDNNSINSNNTERS
jgi:hypothetical protein